MSSSSSSSNCNEWVGTTECKCSRDNYEGYKIEWETHIIKDLGTIPTVFLEALLGVATFGISLIGHISDKPTFTHESVCIHIYCRSCERRNMYLTCELGKEGKSMKWGYNKKRVSCVRTQKLDPPVSYSIIKKIFDEMWDDYHLLSRNCADWARDFYYRIINA
uniref:LRAT domain-containing protein n=1 Tax=Meloidogyne hapla TaxID=6305 RepID=A0A1I8BUZ7_MELHA